MSRETAPEMTVREYAQAIAKFEKTIGARASVSTFVTPASKLPLHCSVYATGSYSKGADFSVDAETFGELFAAVTAKWAEYEGRHRVDTIKKMALAIIRITSDLGECTDAALRNCGEFDPGQVKSYGDEACTVADNMADKGPFSIVELGTANANAEAA